MLAICSGMAEKRKRFDAMLTVYEFPTGKLNKLYRPNKLVTADCLFPSGSVSITVAFLSPRPSGVVTLPVTVPKAFGHNMSDSSPTPPFRVSNADGSKIFLKRPPNIPPPLPVR